MEPTQDMSAVHKERMLLKHAVKRAGLLLQRRAVGLAKVPVMASVVRGHLLRRHVVLWPYEW